MRGIQSVYLMLRQGGIWLLSQLFRYLLFEYGLGSSILQIFSIGYGVQLTQDIKGTLSFYFDFLSKIDRKRVWEYDKVFFVTFVCKDGGFFFLKSSFTVLLFNI